MKKYTRDLNDKIKKLCNQANCKKDDLALIYSTGVVANEQLLIFAFSLELYEDWLDELKPSGLRHFYLTKNVELRELTYSLMKSGIKNLLPKAVSSSLPRGLQLCYIGSEGVYILPINHLPAVPSVSDLSNLNASTVRGG